MERGKLIIFDGMDGAGKTVSIENAIVFLNKRGHDAVKMSSWLCSDYSKAARAFVTSEQNSICPITTLLVAAAAVNHSYNTAIKTLLDEGKTVLLDRGPRSSLALQVWPYMASNPQLLALWNAAFSNYICDLELSFVTDAKKAKERAIARDGKLDAIESMSEDWQMIAREAYIYEKYPIDVIRNYGTLDDLKSTVEHALSFYCARWESGDETAQNFNVRL